MSCKLEDRKPDWNAYALGELNAQMRNEAETHAATCADCQEELASLRVTLDAMAALRDEELPRRIAFVSDKVFEPTLWNRLSQVFLRPVFAGAAVIAAAILFHAFVRPSGIPGASPTVDVAAVEARVAAAVAQQVDREIDRRVEARLSAAVDTAVKKAVAESDERAAQRTAQVLAASERRYADTTDFLSRQVTQLYAVNTGLGVR